MIIVDSKTGTIEEEKINPSTQQVPLMANGCFQIGACTGTVAVSVQGTARELIRADMSGGNPGGKTTGEPAVTGIQNRHLPYLPFSIQLSLSEQE